MIPELKIASEDAVSFKLGHITRANFGLMQDRDFLYGLIIDLSLQDGYYVTGTEVTNINHSESCKYTEEDRDKWLAKQSLKIAKILEDAEVKYINELVGKPVIASFKNNTIQEFRILTEVLK